MRIGIIGTGRMGSTLGKLWAAKGHYVRFGSRDPQKAQSLAKSLGEENLSGGTVSDAVKFGEVILLATPWAAAAEVVKGAGSFEGKFLIDCTNPISPGGGGLAVGHTTSAAEEIAKWATRAKVVKAFNSIYWENLETPLFGTQNASLFFCGDDEEAKKIVANLGTDIGFDPVDSGPLINARYLEPLAFLWIDLAFARGLGTGIALKLLRRR